MKSTNKNGTAWGTKEKILMLFGFLLIAFTAGVWAFAEGHPFQLEFLLAGLAFCGVSITQWGDKK